MSRYGCWLVTVAMLVGSPVVHAQSFDVAAGASVTDSERVTGAAFASVFGNSSGKNRIHFEPIGTVGWIAAHRTRKANMHHEVFLGGGGVRILTGDSRWFVSEQLAVTSARTNALSSSLEFMTSAGWQERHFVVKLRHVSNGHLVGHGSNIGESMLLAGVRW